MKRMMRTCSAAAAAAVLLAAMPVSSVSATGVEEPEVMTATVTLSGDGVGVVGENVTIEGTTITVTASGAYEFTGTLADGQICVNVADEVADPGTVKLYLNGVSMTGVSDAAIYVVNAEKTSINLVAETENSFYGGETYTETDAVICAKDDLTIKGDGYLYVEAPTQFGISCNNDLKITGGEIKVKTALEDGVRGKTSVEVKGGDVDINAEGDGLKSTKGDVLISGGKMEVKAGNDAIQGETSIDLTGGSVLANGDRGLRCDAGLINVAGASVLATATDNQVENLDAQQPVVLVNFAEEYLKDLTFVLVDDASSSDVPVLEMKPDKKFSFALISDPAMNLNTTYSLTIDGKRVEGFEWLKLTENVTIVDGAKITEGGETKDPLRCDIDNSGEVDISDAIMLARYTAEDTTIVIPPESSERTDCNGDGVANAADVILVLSFIAKLIT